MLGVRSRRRIARRAVLAPMAAVTMFAGAGLVAAVSAPAAALAGTPPTMSFGTGGAKVTTHNGKTWEMSVGYDQVIASEAPSVGVILDRTTKGGGVDLNSWDFQLTNGTLAFNSSTGVGTLNTGSQTSPIAKIDLNFTATSHKRATCASGSETIYTGKVTGELVLDTGFKRGGTVGGTHVNFSLGASDVKVDSACTVSVNTCLGGTIFSSGNVKGTFAAGVTENLFGRKKNVDLLDVARLKTFSAPKGASREDIVAAEGPLPTYSGSKVLSITTSPSGLVSGSATLSGGTVKKLSVPCSYKGKHYTVTIRSDFKAFWASPAGHAITGRSGLLGKMTVPASEKRGFYEIVTVS